MNKSKIIFNYAIICLLLSFVSLNAQTKTVITHLNIENKKNGAFVKLFTTAQVESKHITGWTTDDNWFYITVLDAIADSGRVVNSKLSYPVSQIQVHNSEQSTQLALKINSPIDKFEFYQSKSPPEILVSLRFPIVDVATVLEEERVKMEDVEAISEDDLKPSFDESVVSSVDNIPDRYKRIRSALYLSGASLTLAGAAIQTNRDEGFSWEIPTGLAIVAGTYLYDRFIHKSDKE